MSPENYNCLLRSLCYGAGTTMREDSLASLRDALCATARAHWDDKPEREGDMTLGQWAALSAETPGGGMAAETEQVTVESWCRAFAEGAMSEQVVLRLWQLCYKEAVYVWRPAEPGGFLLHDVLRFTAADAPAKIVRHVVYRSNELHYNALKVLDTEAMAELLQAARACMCACTRTTAAVYPPRHTPGVYTVCAMCLRLGVVCSACAVPVLGACSLCTVHARCVPTGQEAHSRARGAAAEGTPAQATGQARWCMSSSTPGDVVGRSVRVPKQTRCCCRGGWQTDRQARALPSVAHLGGGRGRARGDLLQPSTRGNTRTWHPRQEGVPVPRSAMGELVSPLPHGSES